MDSMDKDEFESIAQSGHDYAIDISLHRNLTSSTGNLNGIAYGIPSKWISLSRGAIGN